MLYVYVYYGLVCITGITYVCLKNYQLIVAVSVAVTIVHVSIQCVLRFIGKDAAQSSLS